MAQSYFKARVASPVNDSFADTAFSGLGAEKQLKVEDVQEAYIEQKEKCVIQLNCLQRLLILDILTDWSQHLTEPRLS